MLPASSPGMAVLRRVRGTGPCRRLRVIPDLVVMGEGGEGELAGWAFTARCASAHHSVMVHNNNIIIINVYLCVDLIIQRFSQCLTLWTPHADNEAVQLTAQEVSLLLQFLNALLQPGVLLQSDVQVSSQVRDQD